MLKYSMNSDNLPEIPSTRGDDIHNIEYMHNADLVLFMAGNQFMVMSELLDEFRKEHPEVNKIFYQTLPPGMALNQILAGGARFQDMVIDTTPDIYTSVTENAMNKLSKNDYISDHFIYLHNRVVLMVPKGNPANIKTINDLGNEKVRISQPGALEDITRYIIDMYEDAGGVSLIKKIMEEKRAEGTTILTVVHHRETPLRIKKGTIDVGPVWSTEVVNALKEGLNVEMIDPGDGLDQSKKVNYYITRINKGSNPENAEKFLEFIKSPKAQGIYKSYGFVTHRKSG